MNVNGVNVSSPEFVDSCDEKQLDRLIELAKDRKKKLQDTTKEKFWVVSDGFAVDAYFREADENKAREKMVELVRDGKNEVQMELQKFREEELKGWL